MDILKAYLAILAIMSALIWLIVHTARETRSKTTDVSPEVYNWMHIKNSYWVCEECESELGSRRTVCIDCGRITAKYRVKSKRTKKAS